MYTYRYSLNEQVSKASSRMCSGQMGSARTSKANPLDLPSQVYLKIHFIDASRPYFLNKYIYIFFNPNGLENVTVNSHLL